MKDPKQWQIMLMPNAGLFSLVFLVTPLLTIAQINDILAASEDYSRIAEATANLINDGGGQCSCDCCQVAERLPREIVLLPNGEVMNRKCIKGQVEESRLPESQAPMCPAQCKPGNNDVLFSATGPTDYSRYCYYKCKPIMSTVGSACSRLDLADREEASENTGNGKELMGPTPTMTAEWGDDISEGRLQREEAIKAREEAEQAPQTSGAGSGGGPSDRQLTYDLRKLIAHRYRAQAGAAISHMAASGERVRVNQHGALRASQLAKKMQRAMAPKEATLQESVIAVEGNASAAEEEVKKVEKSSTEAAQEMAGIPSKAKKLAEEKIKKAIKAEADKEAEAYARLLAWDKPEGYDKIMAARSADPYMQAMTAAVTRMSEYEAYANSLLGKARGVQSEVQARVSQANAQQAAGDKIGAATQWTHIHTLLANTKSLEDQAKGAWNTADAARESIPLWQKGGAMAAARTAWEWKELHTPAPQGLM